MLQGYSTLPTFLYKKRIRQQYPGISQNQDQCVITLKEKKATVLLMAL